MTRVAKYRKRFNTTTIAEEALTDQEHAAIDAAKHQSVDGLRRSSLNRSKPVCLRCRKRSHTIRFCPEGGASRCYNCGSSDHTLKGCRMPRQDPLPFAECFICGAQGHLSSQCEKNERGIYPRGGGCRFCGSKQHLARDCRPTREAEQSALVGASRDPKRENPDDDVMFEALNHIQQEIQMKRDQRKKGTQSNPHAVSKGDGSKKKPPKTVSF